MPKFSAALPPATRRRHHAQAGFSLIEVVIATFVMVLGIGSAIIALQAGLRMVDYSRNLTLASQLVQSEMERIRLLPWTEDTGGDSVTDLPASETVDISDAYTDNADITGKFILVRTVTDINSTMKEITLRVTWSGTYGTTSTRTFTTRYCKDGLYDYYYTLAN